MSRIDADRAEIIAMSFWDSLEAIDGPDIQQSVLCPEDEHYLLEPSAITHYEIAGQPAPPHPSGHYPHPARQQAIRLPSGETAWLRKRRAQCGSCGKTYILLPSQCVPRRADAVEVIGTAAVTAALKDACSAADRHGAGHHGRDPARLAAPPPIPGAGQAAGCGTERSRAPARLPALA